jgi:hypothetical protein
MSSEALREALAKAKDFLSQDVTQPEWKPVETKNEAKLWEREIGKSAVSPHPELRLGKAVITIEAPAKLIFDTVWSLEAQRQWDGPTIADAKVVEEVEKGKTEFVHYTHKTLSAAVAKRDVLLLRTWEHNENRILIYGVSAPNPKCPPVNGFIRGEMIVYAIEIVQEAENKCTVTYCSCFDFCGWLHQKFHDQEILRNAQRLVKIKQLVLSKLQNVKK